MKKIIFFIPVLIFILLSGCSTENAEDLPVEISYNREEIIDFHKREISESEIEKFIPVNYSLVKNKYSNKAIEIKKIETDNSFMYLLPLTFNGVETIDNFGTIKDKVMLLSYDYINDIYKIADEFSSLGKITVKDFVDINFDSKNELFVIFSWSPGSGTRNDVFILDVDLDNKKINTIDNNIILVNTDYFNEQNGLITTATYIWDSDAGESHFGCHYFDIYQYKYNKLEQKVEKIKTIRSKKKYTLDVGESMMEDGWLEDCFPLHENFYDFLKKEKIN